MCVLCVHTCKSCVCDLQQRICAVKQEQSIACIRRGCFPVWADSRIWCPSGLPSSSHQPNPQIDKNPLGFRKLTSLVLLHAPICLVQEGFNLIFFRVRTRISVMEKSLAYNRRNTVIPLENLNFYFSLWPGKQQHICRNVGLLGWCLFSLISI